MLEEKRLKKILQQCYYRVKNHLVFIIEIKIRKNLMIQNINQKKYNLKLKKFHGYLKLLCYKKWQKKKIVEEKKEKPNMLKIQLVNLDYHLEWKSMNN